MAALDQLPEAPARDVLLARGDRQVDRVGELRVRLVRVRDERLLEPADPELLELARDADRLLRVLLVPEAGVDQDVDPVAAGVLRRRGQPDVVVGVSTEGPPAELDGGEALLAERGDALGGLLGRVGHQHRRVRAHAIAPDLPEELAHRLAERLAADVPERDVDAADRVDPDPAAADVDQAAVHRVPRAFDVERVAPDERRAEAVGDGVGAVLADESGDDVGGGVDLADPDDALVGVHEDDEVVLAPVRDPVVDGRLSEDDRLDVGDLHAIPPGEARLRSCRAPRPIVDYSEIVNNPLTSSDEAGDAHERLSDPLHDRPGRARQAARAPAGPALLQYERLVEPHRPDRLGRERRRADRCRHRRRPRRRARGPGRRDQARTRARAAGRRGPRDRHPVPLARGLARVHAALAVGREHEPLVPRQPRRPGGRAAGALPLDRDLPALGGRRRHPLRRSHRPLPAVVGDALGRGRRSAAAHGGRDARVEHRLVLRLHRHRRDGPPRRGGGASGQDGDLDRARRRRARDRGDPPARGRRARERPAPRGRPRRPGRDTRRRSGGRRRRS